MTEIVITRPSGIRFHLRIPDRVDWLEVVTRCAKEFTDSGYIGGPELPPLDTPKKKRKLAGSE